MDISIQSLVFTALVILSYFIGRLSGRYSGIREGYTLGVATGALETSTVILKFLKDNYDMSFDFDITTPEELEDAIDSSN